VDERVDGAAVCNFGPGMEAASTIKIWEPPHRYVAESVGAESAEEPGNVATEWIVEARAGGTCVVRVVHRWFTSKDDWDQQFEGHQEGWKSFFRILRLYLTHFAGQPSTAFQHTGFGPEPKEKVWEGMTGLLGIAGAAVGQRLKTADGAPPFAGIVERVGEAAYPEELLLRLDEPAPGVAHFFAMALGGQILLSMRFYLYGPKAAAAAANVEPLWQAWIKQHFPAPG